MTGGHHAGASGGDDPRVASPGPDEVPVPYPGTTDSPRVHADTTQSDTAFVDAGIPELLHEPVPTVFLGTGEFAVPVLDALLRVPAVSVVGIVTAPARPAGRHGRLRPSPVAARAAGLAEEGGPLARVPLLTPERLRAPDAVDAVLGLQPRLLVLADYGQIVPAGLLDAPRHGALNLHPSLLPRHRGASPIPAAILAGDSQTGVTLMQMDPGMDTGPVVAQVAVPLGGTETAPEMEALLAEEAGGLLEALLPAWVEGRLHPRPQASEGVTVTRPLRRSDGWLDPARPAAYLERQVRAYQPWPGSYVETPGGRLIVWRARPLSLEGLPADVRVPAMLVPDDDGLALTTADGALRLDDVQLAGGRRMPAAELRRGHPELAGCRIEGIGVR